MALRITSGPPVGVGPKVGRDRERVGQPVSELRQFGASAGGHHDRRAGTGQRLGEPRAQAGGRAGDDGHAPVQPEQVGGGQGTSR